MTYEVIIEQVSKGKIKPAYLLFGEEQHLIRKVEQAVINVVLSPEEREMNLLVFESDPPIQELLNAIETVPFLGGSNVIVVRNTTLFRSKKGASQTEGEDESTDNKVENQLLQLLTNIPEYSKVIFIAGDKVDKRKKLYKVMEKSGFIGEFVPLKAKDIRPWLMTKLNEVHKKMSNDAIEHLLAVVSIMPHISLDFLDSEINKAALYVKNKELITKADLMAVLSAIPEVSIFALLEAVGQKQVGKALQLLGEQFSIGEHPVRILALLSRQVRQLWQARELADSGYSSHETAARLGVPPFIADKLIRQGRSFSSEKLKIALLQLAAADHSLKSGLAGGVILEQILIEMCV